MVEIEEEDFEKLRRADQGMLAMYLSHIYESPMFSILSIFILVTFCVERAETGGGPPTIIRITSLEQV